MTGGTKNFDLLLEQFHDLLKKDGLKLTRQRDMILKILFDSEGHVTPEQLFFTMQRDYPELNIGIATIYRTLALLEKSGMISSISFGTDGKKYELSDDEHHDHMICSSCGSIIEFVDPTIEKIQEEIAKRHNFLMTGHLMQIFGICASCQLHQKDKGSNE